MNWPHFALNDEILAQSLSDLRRRLRLNADTRGASARDYLAFALWAALGIVILTASLATILSPIAFLVFLLI